MITPEQKLVDICFQLVLTVLDPKYVTHMRRLTPEEQATWVRKQLEECGFNTEPCGSSWGVLR